MKENIGKIKNMDMGNTFGKIKGLTLDIGFMANNMDLAGTRWRIKSKQVFGIMASDLNGLVYILKLELTEKKLILVNILKRKIVDNR